MSVQNDNEILEMKSVPMQVIKDYLTNKKGLIIILIDLNAKSIA